MNQSRMITLCLLFVFVFSTAFAQKKARIKDIIENPGVYENELVEIEGIVTQYVEGTTSTTSYFFVLGDFAGKLKVNTSLAPPVTQNRYKFRGTLIIDPMSRKPILIEKERITKSGLSQGLMYALIAAVGVLIVFLIIYFVRTRKKSGGSNDATKPVTPSMTSEPVAPAAGVDEDYATIKISSGAPPTMVLVPGRLEIIAGSDKGKSFKIAGYPGPEGSVVTIGRETVEGEKKFAHIQLMEKTVSRKQAEIIHANKKLYVKNLSTTNQTEVDGKGIQQGAKVELLPGSVVKTGEVEFKYLQ